MVGEVYMTEEIWVNSTEGAEITGYHRDHVQELARKTGKNRKLSA
jgi:hypothetical protein